MQLICNMMSFWVTHRHRSENPLQCDFYCFYLQWEQKKGSSDIWSDSMLKKKTAEQFVYLNNDKQMYSYEQQFSISCLGFV